jgi:hypothetical protein
VFLLIFSFLRGQKKLASGGIRLTANDFPAFLWSGNPPGCDYDDDAMTEGLLQGYLIERVSSFFDIIIYIMLICVKVMRHIFTGPSTALGQDSRATRTCNAALHDMTTVEAEHIAYACVQVSLSILVNAGSHCLICRHVLESARRINGQTSTGTSNTRSFTTTSSTSFATVEIQTG